MPLPRALAPAVLALCTFVPACSADLPDEPARNPPPPGGAAVIVVPGEAPEPVAAAPVAALPAGGIAAVSAEGVVDVDVTVGAPAPARIACSAKQIPKIHVEAQGDVLHVWTEPGFRHRRGPCTVFVGVASLRALDVSGPGSAHVHGRADGLASVRASGPGSADIEEIAGDAAHIDLSGPGSVTVQRLRARSIAIDSSGPGAVHVAGTGERVKIDSSGPGSIEARELAALDVEVNASGPGSIAATASRRARVNASGPGSVVIAGQPADRRAHRNGLGSVAFE
jgi:hypothetical protein